ncbi:unnamed protein product [Acanthocheilonema viteae]|uniref:BPTI/Kunitz inhibitor domain-containing protein n=1 Tax=Acanthocheilonema viteae TaxID=6277 RepID=A0A498SLK6_ACAVI|nr:unnamed protein product [Acanthocheilonema viteae]
MLLSALHCFIPQLTVLFLFIAGTDQNAVDGDATVRKTDEAFFPHIFKFLYKNEQLCGDVFAEPQWLPAQSDCQILCPVCFLFFMVPADCTSELQRLLVTSALTNTTPAATINIIPTNVTTISYTIIDNFTSNAVKYHKGKNEVWNELHRRIHANYENSGTTNTTLQPASELSWNGHGGKRKETQFKGKFHENSA